MARLAAAAAMAGGRLSGDDAEFCGVTSDTRALARGDLFVALQGCSFDGHDFARRAVSLGAAGCMVAREIDALPAQIVVDDTLLGLQRLAGAWRARLHLPVVAVVGSNGKTTTKQLLAAVLSGRRAVLATAGNLNNHIGVPLTLLQLRAAHRAAVIEIGANHPGEIAPLARLAAPMVTVVTCSGEDHLEGFGSVQGSARTNGEALEALPRDGVAVLPAEDPQLALWRAQSGGRTVLTFGFAAGAEVRAQALVQGAESSRFELLTPAGTAAVRLPLPGRHNVANALAAAAAAHALGLTPAAIAAGLACVEAPPGRSRWLAAAGGVRVLDDSYNANPASVRAALELLAARPAPRIAVLGDMAELGAQAAALHRAVGEYARALGVEYLLALGTLSRHAAAGFGAGAQTLETLEQLLAALHPLLTPAASVLVKGSRSARMERVVAALCQPRRTEARR
ncbi:MAG: UDP-N-acetylmuramoyl-tripeptide--D-alanyl-D-alanine ligase [Gammaproteobacteria bacterium]|nr:UDP-N-acetylmuramoyl-tripeptide--D-alanyl-D-alanine ligase [Gammaproteobacteria bacterium]